MTAEAVAVTVAVSRSDSPARARERLAAKVAEWGRERLAAVARRGPGDSHDQGTVLTGPAPVADLLPGLVPCMKGLRDRIRDRFTSAGTWLHGYWCEQEAHHGSEHFGIFLTCLHRLDPTDRDTARQLLDAAEHMLNRVPHVPDRLDTDTGLFRSMWLGGPLPAMAATHGGAIHL